MVNNSAIKQQFCYFILKNGLVFILTSLPEVHQDQLPNPEILSENKSKDRAKLHYFVDINTIHVRYKMTISQAITRLDIRDYVFQPSKMKISMGVNKTSNF